MLNQAKDRIPVFRESVSESSSGWIDDDSQPSSQTPSERTPASEVETARDHFLAHLTHEIRTPLTSLLMGLHLIQKKQDDSSELSSWITICVEEGERLRLLVEQLLRASRIGSGANQSKAVTREPRSLKALIQSALRSTQFEAQLREVLYGETIHDLLASSVRAESDGSDFQVLCDGEQLAWSFEQVLFHLIRNGKRNERIHYQIEARENGALVLNLEIQRFAQGIAPQTYIPVSIAYQLREGKVGHAATSIALDLFAGMNLPIQWVRAELPTSDEQVVLSGDESQPTALTQWIVRERFSVFFQPFVSSGGRPRVSSSGGPEWVR